MQFDDNYFEMMRANMRAAGMPDAQIDAMIEMQRAAMGTINIDADTIAAASANATALAEQMGGMEYDMDASGFEYIQNPSLNDSYQWAIACGADLAYLRGDILNDLNTDTDTDGSGDVLENDWGIENHDDAVQMCDSLLAGRHSTVYNDAAKTGTGKHAENIRAANEIFSADGLTRANEIPNMLIWDLGRLVTVCRLAFDAGWLSRDETMQYLRELAPRVQGAYKSWRDMSVAYQFGRAVWGGVDEFEYQIMKSNMEELLTEVDSPWNKMPFDMKLEF